MKMADIEREPKLGWDTRSLTDPVVAQHLAATLADTFGGTVMIDSKSRWGRSHLKLRMDKGGYFVRVGRRGSCKQYLGRCKITFFDGKPTLLQFTFADTDAFDAEQDRRWCLANGIQP